MSISVPDAQPESQPPQAAETAGQTSVARHYFRYLNANLLCIMAGFISMPIMTRWMAKEEYGLLATWDKLALIWVAVLKLGTQHSIVRLYAQWCIGATAERRRQFYTTLILAPGVISTALFLVTLLAIPVFHHFWPERPVSLLVIVLCLGQVSVLASLIDNTLWAKELSRLSAVLSVVGTWMRLALVLSVVFYMGYKKCSAGNVLLTQLFVAGLMLAWRIRWASRSLEFGGRGSYSPAILKDSLSYGLPLVVNELDLILLAYVDRAMILGMLGASAVEQNGIYAIAYEPAMYIGTFLRASLTPAFQPVANRLFETQGHEAVQHLKRRILHVLLYVLAAIAIGLVVVGRDLFLMIVGAEHEDSVKIFVIIGLNYLLWPLGSVATYGLLLIKRAKTYTAIVFVSMLVNVLINLWAIPRYGIMGATWATLGSYILMWGLLLAFCPRSLWPHFGLGDVARPAALAALMFFAARWTGLFGAQGHAARLAAMAAVFVVAYVAPALAIDKLLRETIWDKAKVILPARWRMG